MMLPPLDGLRANFTAAEFARSLPTGRPLRQGSQNPIRQQATTPFPETGSASARWTARA